MLGTCRSRVPHPWNFMLGCLSCSSARTLGFSVPCPPRDAWPWPFGSWWTPTLDHVRRQRWWWPWMKYVMCHIWGDDVLIHPIWGSTRGDQQTCHLRLHSMLSIQPCWRVQGNGWSRCLEYGAAHLTSLLLASTHHLAAVPSQRRVG